MSKSKYDGKSFATRAHKNGRELWIPAHQQLREILGNVPRTDAVTLVANRHGRPYTEEGFRGSFFKLIRGLNLNKEGEIGTGLSFHGLHHTTGKLLAEADCTTEDIMEISVSLVRWLSITLPKPIADFVLRLRLRNSNKAAPILQNPKIEIANLVSRFCPNSSVTL